MSKKFMFLATVAFVSLISLSAPSFAASERNEFADEVRNGIGTTDLTLKQKRELERIAREKRLQEERERKKFSNDVDLRTKEMRDRWAKDLATNGDGAASGTGVIYSDGKVPANIRAKLQGGDAKLTEEQMYDVRQKWRSLTPDQKVQMKDGAKAKWKTLTTIEKKQMLTLFKEEEAINKDWDKGNPNYKTFDSAQFMNGAVDKDDTKKPGKYTNWRNDPQRLGVSGYDLKGRPVFGGKGDSTGGRIINDSGWINDGRRVAYTGSTEPGTRSYGTNSWVASSGTSYPVALGGYGTSVNGHSYLGSIKKPSVAAKPVTGGHTNWIARTD